MILPCLQKSQDTLFSPETYNTTCIIHVCLCFHKLSEKVCPKYIPWKFNIIFLIYHFMIWFFFCGFICSKPYLTNSSHLNYSILLYYVGGGGSFIADCMVWFCSLLKCSTVTYSCLYRSGNAIWSYWKLYHIFIFYVSFGLC